MITFILAIFVIWAIWKIKALIHRSPYINISKTSVPLIKNSLNLAFATQEEMFLFPRKCAEVLKESYQLDFFMLFSFNVIKAKDVEMFLGSSKHLDKNFIYDFLHPFLKTGLLTSSGNKWHSRRRMLTPAFHFDILKEYFEVFREESDRLVDTLKQGVEKELNIISISTQFTLNTICESAMGVKLGDLGNDGAIYRQRIYEIGNSIISRIIKPWLHPNFLHSLFGYQKELDAMLVPVHDFTKSIINERKLNFVAETKVKENIDDDSENVYFRSKKRRYAMMDTLLQAQSQGLIDDEGIIEETDTFTFEGHDTTSAAMTFTLLLLAHNPDAQEKILAEIHNTLQDKQTTELSINDYNRMEYLDCVIKESLRIYPSVPFISRTFSEDVTIDGVTHRKGSSLNIFIYEIHRDPEFFPDPERFDPDRFLPENCEGRNNYAFIAFSAGMRNCIGQKFAMLELKVMLTKVIKNFKISPVTTREEVVFISDLVLRSRDSIKMKFHLRK